HTRRIFHVPQALVDIYQQPSGHVNLNHHAVWQASEATLRDFGADYSEAARKVFRDKARLRFCTFERGHFREMLGMCVSLIQERGTRDSRLILNCFLWKLPCMRRWLVH